MNKDMKLCDISDLYYMLLCIMLYCITTDSTICFEVIMYCTVADYRLP